MSLLVPLIALIATGAGLYATSGSRSASKVKNLQITGIKGSLDKHSSSLLSNTLILDMTLFNPNNNQVAIQRLIGGVVYDGKTVGKVDYKKDVIIKSQKEGTLPGIRINIPTLSLGSSLMDFLKTKDEEQSIIFKGQIKLDGFIFPFEQKVILRAGKQKAAKKRSADQGNKSDNNNTNTNSSNTSNSSLNPDSDPNPMS
ncbi:MAG: hypothetical protein ACXVNR_07575 [Bacteroidia bacterium]